MSKWSEQEVEEMKRRGLEMWAAVCEADANHLRAEVLDLRERAEKAEQRAEQAEREQAHLHERRMEWWNKAEKAEQERDQQAMEATEWATRANDVRSRAEAAEQRADEHYETILALNEQVQRATKDNTSLDTTCRELTKRLAASEQRCAALEAALDDARKSMHRLWDAMVVPRTYDPQREAAALKRVQAALSGDTSALREMVNRAIEAGRKAGMEDQQFVTGGYGRTEPGESDEAIAKRVMEGR